MGWDRDFSRLWSERGWGDMYQSIFVGGLLPLLGHSAGLLAGKGVNGVEEGNGDSNELGHLCEHAQALTLGGLGAGAVGAEGNVVSYSKGRIDVSEKMTTCKDNCGGSRGRAIPR